MKKFLSLMLVVVMLASMFVACNDPTTTTTTTTVTQKPDVIVDPNADNYAAAVALAKSWGTESYLYYKQLAYDRLMDYFKNPTNQTIPGYKLEWAEGTVL